MNLPSMSALFPNISVQNVNERTKTPLFKKMQRWFFVTQYQRQLYCLRRII